MLLLLPLPWNFVTSPGYKPYHDGNDLATEEYLQP